MIAETGHYALILALGVAIVQTLLPLMLTHVAEGRLSLERLVDLTSHGANRIFDLADKGRMAVGYDADLTIVDLKARRTITHEAMATRSGWTLRPRWTSNCGTRLTSRSTRPRWSGAASAWMVGSSISSVFRSREISQTTNSHGGTCSSSSVNGARCAFVVDASRSRSDRNG